MLLGELMAHGTVKPESLVFKKLSRHWPWLVLVLVILVSAGVRWRLRTMPLERDEGEYAYAGQLILQGIPPYKLVYNMKLPGTYAAYAVLMAVFGQTAAGIHVGLIVVNIASIILVFLLARKLLDAVAGAAAAVAYGLMSLSPSVMGLQAHATHFVVLPALGGALVLLEAAESRRWWPLFASGLLFGLAFVMKQHGALFGVFGSTYLVWATIRVEPDPRGKRLYRPGKTPLFQFDWQKCGPAWGLFGLGMALPYLLTCGVLVSVGVTRQFFFWTLTYANQYISAVPLGNASELFRYALYFVAGPNLCIWLLSVLGAVVMWWEPRLERRRFFVVVFFLCSAVSNSIGFYFRPHYFILLLPALSLLAGIAVSRGIHVLRQERTLELIPAVITLLLLVAGLGSELLTQSSFWFEYAPDKACRQIYGNSLFPEALRVAEYVRANSTPQANIAVIGSEPEIYFYAKRHSATGYIYMYPLMEFHAYALKMQEEMIQEVEKARPEFVVFVSVSQSWLQQESSHLRLQNWWAEYGTAHYELVRTTEINEEKLDETQLTPAEFGVGLPNPSNPSNPASVEPGTTSQAKSGTISIFKRRESPSR